MNKNRMLRIRISQKQENELKSEHERSDVEKLSVFIRQIIFLYGLPYYRKYTQEKQDWEKLKRWFKG